MDTGRLLFSQRVISDLSNLHVSSIHRCINSSSIPHEAIQGKKIKHYSIGNTRKICKKLLSDKITPHSKVHVFYNFKGGTGKTSICFQTAANLSILGFKVLVVDCDPQAHLSTCFGVEDDVENMTIHDVLMDRVPITKAIIPILDGLELIPANLALTSAEIELSHLNNREKLLQKRLKLISESYDFILIDANPTISIMNFNALFAADKVIIVCETQPFSLSGLSMVIEQIHTFSEDMEKEISYEILANKYDPKTATAQEILGAMRSNYKGFVMNTVISRCEDFNISAKKRLPLAAFKNAKSTAFEDMSQFSHELIQKSAISSLKAA